ncbi:MAG: hypothetical protein M4579_000977 [Chaenotheca gracillima]|nr:MAG: hypothetical protein M4579_000977 [Chaenotheca gracillima]
MLSSGFTNTPASRIFLLFVVLSSILASITDSKYLFYIQVVPHLWRYKQAWRIFVWQICFTNSTEVLFGSMLLYQMRVIERLWGTRKFASFAFSTLPYTTILPPLLLALMLRPLTFGRMNYLPAGPTPLIFALLAQYHAAIPQIYKYRVSMTTSPSPATGSLLFSDKSTTYLLAVQLAFSQLPGSLLSASIGWIVGYAWRNDLLIPGVSRWRLPGWILHDETAGQRYEGLRRRLEGENAVAGEGRATGVDEAMGRGEATQRRTLGTQILDQFRGRY